MSRWMWTNQLLWGVVIQRVDCPATHVMSHVTSHTSHVSCYMQVHMFNEARSSVACAVLAVVLCCSKRMRNVY